MKNNRDNAAKCNVKEAQIGNLIHKILEEFRKNSEAIWSKRIPILNNS